jgi:hypothetical protein
MEAVYSSETLATWPTSTGWAPVLVWMLWQIEYSCPTGNQKPDHPTHNLVTILTELPWIPVTLDINVYVSNHFGYKCSCNFVMYLFDTHLSL